MTSAPDDERQDDAARREGADARREADALRRDREKAERASAKEAEKGRRDREKLDRQAAKDAERERRDADRRERDRLKTVAETEAREREVRKNAEAREREARKNDDQAQRERERQAREAAREAGRAMREAAKASRDAALAEQRAQREAERALVQARRAEPEVAAELVDLPPDLAVLWRRPAPARRGPRPGLSLDQIADAAIQLADAEGLEAVSMARLAESLGFTTMSLYRYVASKDEVLALMSDRVGGRPVPVGREVGDWRARLEVLLEQMQPIVRAHPWMSRTTTVLFAVGPNRLAWMEAMVAALEDTPLSEAQKLQAVGVLASHQLEFARQVEGYEYRRRAIARARGGDEPPGAEHPETAVVHLLSPDEHPALLRAATGGGFDGRGTAAPDALDFGTTLILDGIARLVDSGR